MKIKQVFLVAFLCLATLTSSWANRSLDEYTLKAALIVKLVRFIYLPEDKQYLSNLNLCVIGSNPFGDRLNKLTSKPIDGIKIQVKNLNRYNNEVCDFSFITQASSPALASLLKSLEYHQSVTISDISNFAKKGGMIELALPNTEEARLQILVNIKNAEEQQIKFSAQLLRLASLVG